MLDKLILFAFNFFSKLIISIQDKIYPLRTKKINNWNISYRKREELHPVQEEAFVCSFLNRENIQKLLEPNHVAVNYTDRKTVILKSPGDVYNTEKYPFFYHGAYKEATSKITVPITDFVEFIDEQPWPEVNLIFLWSVGRCGSTLLANLFTSFDGFVTISEPDDIFMFMHYKEGMGDALCEKALKNSLKYHLIQVKARYPKTKCVIIKPRSMCFWYIVKTPVEIQDKVTHIFMYRDTMPTLKSFVKSFGNFLSKMDSFMAKVFDLKSMIQGTILPLEATIANIAEARTMLEDAAKIRAASNEMIGQMCYGGLPYLILLYKVLLSKGTFGDCLFAVKYERLIAEPVQQFELIAGRVKSFEFTISDEERARLRHLSTKDSQANSSLSQKTLSSSKLEIEKDILQHFYEMMSALDLEAANESGFLLQETV